MTRDIAFLLIAILLSTSCRNGSEERKDTGWQFFSRPAAENADASIELSRKHRRLHEAADTFFERVLVPADFNGGMILAKNGAIVFERYRGLERLDRPDSMDASSPLHIASVSKTFTAMAVLRLHEEGRLDMDDKVAARLTGFPFPDITIKDLLNHRSGLPNYVHFMEDLGWDPDSLLTNEKLLRFIADKREILKVNPPGRHFSYSNTNYALLALVIERVAGKPYAEHMKEAIFRPLGMNDTFVFGMDKSDYAIPSYDHKGKPEPFDFLDAVYGDKNIYSTPRDLLKWDRTLYPGGMFSVETLDSAFKGYSNEKPGIRNYGLGWRLIEPPAGKKVVFHNGWWHGNNAVFSRLPSDTATVIVLGNRYTRRIYEARNVFRAFEGYGEAAESDE